MLKSIHVILAFAIAAMAPIGAYAAPKSLSANWQGDYQIRNSSAELTSCDNSTGNQITFTGTVMAIGGVVSEITATNNMKGTKSFTVLSTSKIDLNFTEPTKKFEKRGSVGGVGGNPFIGFYWKDAPASPDIILGRCVQGAKASIDRDGFIQNFLKLTVSTSECSPSKTTANSYHNNTPNGGNGMIFLENSINNTQHYADASGILTSSPVSLGNPTPAEGTRGNGLAGGNPHLYIKAWVAARDVNSPDGLLHATPGNTSTPLVANSNKPITFDGGVQDAYLGRCRDLL